MAFLVKCQQLASTGNCSDSQCYLVLMRGTACKVGAVTELLLQCHALQPKLHLRCMYCFFINPEPAVQLFDKAARAFEGWILRGIDERLRDALMSAEPGEAENALFNLFARFVLANFSEQIKNYR